MTKLSQAEAAFVKEAYHIREKLAEHDLSSFHLEFEISGRVSTGDLKFLVKLGDSCYSNVVEGNSSQAVLDEYLRRKGFADKHDALCLPSIMPPALNGEQHVTLDLSQEVA